MACETGTWASVLPQNADPDDGTIIISVVHGNGAIEGKHRKKNADPGDEEDLQMGECKNDHIKFDLAGFHYEGDILGRIIKGTRKNTARTKLDGDEVWVGVKTA